MNEITTRTVDVRPGLPLTIAEGGAGRVALVLHGGGGPATVQGLVAHLAQRMHVIAPIHPGWMGTERPAWFTGVDDLALAYLHLLKDAGHRDVLVVGSSIGGWIACEMAVRDDGELISGLVLVNAGGIAVEGEPIRDVFALDPRGLTELSFHDPNRFFVDPATLPEAQQAGRRANAATLRIIAGDPYMHDPKLRRRLGRVQVPALVVWGASDRVITPAYGRALAAAMPSARFELIAEAGHLPHLEQPRATFEAIDAFLAAPVRT